MLKFKYCECGCRGSSSVEIGHTSYWICKTRDGYGLYRGHGSSSPLLKECATYEAAVQYATEDARIYLDVEQKKLAEVRRQINQSPDNIVHHNYWILFTTKRELAVDNDGPAILDHYSEDWIRAWDISNPQNAPHHVVKYSPVSVIDLTVKL
jgi:hypothetical protein